MQLIIDIGNSSVKYYYAGQEFSSLDKLPKGVVTTALVISTVPSQNNIEQDNFIIWAGKEASVHIYDPQQDSKLKGLYAGIGADRIAKLEAARRRYPNRDIILFDFGTATTMTVCNSQGEFLGGFIALGLEVSLKALGNCSELPSLDLTSMRSQSRVQNLSLGNTTNEAILSGALLAHNALIDSWLESARKTTNNAVTIATGGQRELFATKFDHSISAAELFN